MYGRRLGTHEAPNRAHRESGHSESLSAAQQYEPAILLRFGNVNAAKSLSSGAAGQQGTKVLLTLHSSHGAP